MGSGFLIHYQLGLDVKHLNIFEKCIDLCNLLWYTLTNKKKGERKWELKKEKWFFFHKKKPKLGQNFNKFLKKFFGEEYDIEFLDDYIEDMYCNLIDNEEEE